MKDTNYEAPYYVIISIIHLLNFGLHKRRRLIDWPAERL